MLVRISSIIRAWELAQDWSDKVVSLVDPDQELPTFQVPHLIVHMHDTEVITDPWSPKADDIVRVFDFVGKCDKVLVHCFGGISRSVAIGLGLLVSDGMSVQDALIQAHDDSPNMAPNKLILQLIDDHLKMDGKFITAVNTGVAHLPKDLWLWCSDCKINFKDADGHICSSDNWITNT